jgi:hypothetical protein
MLLLYYKIPCQFFASVSFLDSRGAESDISLQKLFVLSEWQKVERHGNESELSDR